MLKVLMAWEMGANFGHAALLGNLARAIKRQARDAEITLAVKRPEVMFRFADDLDFRLMQAPYCPYADGKPGAERFRPVRLYSDELWSCGYHDPQVLAGLLRSWSDLFELINPDLLIEQAAPTALIAAKGFDFPCVAFGHSYDIPPRTEPLGPLYYWENNDRSELIAREAAVLSVINSAMDALKRPKIESFAKAIGVDGEFLPTFAELDHYPERVRQTQGDVRYYGGMFSTEDGEELHWNESASKRIFGYLRTNSQGFKECVFALNALSPSFDVILSCPGISEALRKKIEKPNLRIVDGPARLSTLLPDCNIGISHSSQGTACAFAYYGVPQLLLPSHIEQFMGARAIGEAGLGLALWGEYGPEKVLEFMKYLIQDPRYRTAARAFAEKHQRSAPDIAADAIASDVLALISL